MPINPADIQPAAGAPAPATPPPEEGADKEGAHGIPEELLRQPFMAALLKGKPAAVYVDNEAPPPEAEVVVKNADALAEAGFRIYPSTSKPVTIFYNAAVLPPEEVKKADEGNQLDQIAVPFQELQEAFAGLKAGDGGKTAEEAPPTDQAAPVAAGGTPPPANPKLQRARVKNLQPGAPTSGPSPGQGRLLNNIQKTVI